MYQKVSLRLPFREKAQGDLLQRFHRCRCHTDGGDLLKQIWNGSRTLEELYVGSGLVALYYPVMARWFLSHINVELSSVMLVVYSPRSTIFQALGSCDCKTGFVQSYN